MHLIATLFKLNRLNDILNVADGLIIGHAQFGTRLTNAFELDEIIRISNQTKRQKKALFLMANQMMDDEQLQAFDAFIKSLPIDHFKGIVVADLGAVMVLKSLGLQHLAIYHPETLHTNMHDFNFLSRLSVFGAFVAKEIVLEDIITIAQNKKHNLFITGHGHLNMFYSKRHLIKNFTEYAKISKAFENNQQLKIIESERDDSPYPILEDLAGTHVFRCEVLSSYDVLDQLKKHVDYMIIDAIFKDDDYTIDIIKLYQNKVKDHTLEIKRLQDKYKETWDDGFYNKKTVYKK